MDPFDEFEFKPLTEGLGFHKKKLELKDEVRNSGLLEENIQNDLPPGPSLIPENFKLTSKEKELFRLDLPFPGEKRSVEVKQPHFPGAPSSDLDQLNLGHTINEDIRGTAATMPGGYLDLRPIPFDLASTVLDGVIVLSLSLLCTVTVLLITGVDLRQVMAAGMEDYATQLGFGVLYLSIWQIYAIIARSFFGATLGEWAFDIQLGDKSLQSRSYYPLLVVWRSLINLATGIVFFPLLSTIFRRDLCRYVTGTQLYRRM